MKVRVSQLYGGSFDYRVTGTSDLNTAMNVVRKVIPDYRRLDNATGIVGSDEVAVFTRPANRVKQPQFAPDFMPVEVEVEGFSVKVPNMDYEISLTVSGVKEEHAAYVAQTLFILQRLFSLDGSDVETSLSACRGSDLPGVERIYDLIPYADEVV